MDVSAQQSSAQAALGMVLAAPNNGGFAVRRVAGGLRGTFPIRFSFPCRDGYVTVLPGRTRTWRPRRDAGGTPT